MKNLSAIFLAFLVAAPFAYGQNYQTVNSGRSAYFEAPFDPLYENNVQTLIIDSQQVAQQDSVFRPGYIFHSISRDDCYSPELGSWVGPQVIIQDNGINLFFNVHKDTIRIDTRAALNDSWVAMHLPGSLTVEATVVSHDTMHFLGLIDSVKTIHFQAYDGKMDSISELVNYKEIQISKQYGFVKAVNFALFPGEVLRNSSERFTVYPLVGLSNPKVGVQNLTMLDVHDYAVGDEIHIFYSNRKRDQNGYGTNSTSKQIYRYLARQDYQDSVSYQVRLTQSVSTTTFDSDGEHDDYELLDDTIMVTYKSDSVFDTPPGIVVPESGYHFSMPLWGHSQKVKPSPSRHLQNWSGDSCWTFQIVDGCLSSETFHKGVGGPYFSCTHAFYLGGIDRELLYYKKGNDTWGSPLDLTGMKEANVANSLHIFPNPASGLIRLQWDDLPASDLQLELVDLNGRTLVSKSVTEGKPEVDISALEPGLYIYKVRSEGDVIKTGKVVVE